MKPRYLDAAIRKDLDRRMVFLGGPRQVEKTTLGTVRNNGGRSCASNGRRGEAAWSSMRSTRTRDLRYFGDRLAVEHRYLVTYSEKDHYLDKKDNIHVLPASRFLTALI